MSKSAWEIDENAREFLEFERSAIPGAELQFSIIGKIAEEWCESPGSILDLGCGDGVLGRYLLAKYPEATCVFADFSDEMLRSVTEKLTGTEGAHVVKADFSTADWPQSAASYKPYDLIVSGFAIHHMTDERKKEIYAEIYEILSPGGVFLHLEHVLSANEEVGKLFLEFYVDHLHGFHSSHGSGQSRQEIKEGFENRPDKDEDKLAEVTEQCTWLREIGFKDVDCYFKLFEISIFGGRK